jgi:Glutaredoxin-like domain (DUF836)
MPADGHHRLVLYERAGCHLCEDAATILDVELGRAGYERVDIDTDDDLIVRYGFRVPVVSLDGADRLEAPIDPLSLRRLAAEIRGSGG